MAKRISQLPAETAPAVGDEFPFYDLSTGTTKRATLANILLGVTGGTLISNAAIKAKHADFSVADQTARDAISSPWEGLIVYRKDVDTVEIYTGSSWMRFDNEEILCDVTLGSAATTISSGTITAKKLLTIELITIASGGALATSFRINGDSAANYAYRYSLNQAATTTVVSQTAGGGPPLASDAGLKHSMTRVLNLSGQEKILFSATEEQEAAGAGNAPGFSFISNRYASNTQLTSIVFTTSTNQYAAGTRLIIRGKD